MEMSELVVQKALSLGATEAEAYMQRAKTIRVEYSDVVESIKAVESMGVGLRVALGKKKAMYSTSILDEAEIDEAAARAVKLARVAPEDPHWHQMNPTFGKSSVDGCDDDDARALDHHEIVEALGSAITIMKEYDKRVKPTRGILNISDTNISVANSHGESGQRKETHVVAWMRTKAKEAGMESTGNEHQEARFWGEINLENLAMKAAEKAVKFLRAKPIPGGETSAIFKNQIFASILGVMLSGPVNADWVQKGRSPLSDKLGSEIASEDITIIDDGLLPRGWRTRPFDEEGHPTQSTPILGDGILKNYLYDTYTALKDGVGSTGNAYRSNYWMPPQPSTSNLILEKGTAEPEEIIQETKRGIYVEQTIGEWLSNPVSGNINATVTHGHIVKNGELTEPIKGVIISGNFYELLKDGIEILGNDQRNNMQNYSPTVKLSRLTIAGK